MFLCRRYPTVERRAKLVSPKLYHPIPGDSELAQAVQLKCTESTQKVTVRMHIACMYVVPAKYVFAVSLLLSENEMHTRVVTQPTVVHIISFRF